MGGSSRPEPPISHVPFAPHVNLDMSRTILVHETTLTRRGALGKDLARRI